MTPTVVSVNLGSVGRFDGVQPRMPLGQPLDDESTNTDTIVRYACRAYRDEARR